MDSKVGGRRFYAMVSPEGDERWAVQKYTSITPMQLNNLEDLLAKLSLATETKQ